MARLVLAALMLFPAAGAQAGRLIVSLDGEWEIADSAEDRMPASFDRRVPVPGLANLARPPFAGVDRFDSRELIDNRIRRGQLPPSARTQRVGIPRQDRTWFWYRRSFRPPERRQVAILRINKAQFGTAVWVNGEKIGEHLGCFTAGIFDITRAVRWDQENSLVVRVGAHPAALPEWAPAGTDFEKTKWTPGIYDSVSLHLADNPVIEWVQVAPRIDPPEITVQVRIRNYGPARSFALTHRVTEWKSGREVARAPLERLRIDAGAEVIRLRRIPIPSGQLWSPERPFLYAVETATDGDQVTTRFGLREFRFDTPTRRACLNGRVYFLRGSNITLHRFFEDPECKDLPWREEWVRKLLADVPKRMHWNSFRFCIGPAPDQWLDIADEAGLLIQNEFFVWTGRDGYHREWDTDEMIRQYSEWLRDNWNHPSVVIWDASNETIAPIFAERIIPTVRQLDLSNRPWENGYNLPAGPDDPVEDHPYLFSSWQSGREPRFRLSELERGVGAKSTNSAHPTAHAAILNEYGWLWLNRDGTPTELTGKVYEQLVGPNASAEERFEANAYYLAGLTEYWRAHRNYAGVLHFVYLTASFPGAFTSDHWRDVARLELEPRFARWVGEAFKPLGVYLNFWQPSLRAGAERDFAVMLINDEDAAASGEVTLALEAEGRGELASGRAPFSLPPLGQQTVLVRLRAPDAAGPALLTATARRANGEATVSRRKVEITRD
jgi:beta-galactosidase